MATIKEQREILEAYERGEEIEFADKEDLEEIKDAYEWLVLKSGIIDYEFDFYNYEYRIKRKICRAEKDGTYYFVNACMEICEWIDTYCPDDADHYKVGNYFRTEEDAEKAKDFLIKTLTKFHEENE